MIQAQDNIVPIEISQEKIIVDGVIYYLHTVEKGQTLYSISKAYNISFFEITQENPDVMFGLMIGHVLKIPETGLKKKEEEENRFTFHHVEKGQTVYSLTKQYNIDTSILFSLNPDVRNGLKTDMVLKIPKEKKELTPDEEDYILYKVKRKDTLYSLSREFNVTISNIKEYNEELKTSQL
ncbi:MAG: LysM peptidoglycan-binding domain-containing protein, partial [Bacteroidales bacterium]|nr:LysM peptidoglycan-binding domain-containing protein [Bacteroidales bacterium]